jgi:hypothetical protein
LNVEVWEMELDYEIDLVLDKEAKANLCPKCGWMLKDNRCTNRDCREKGKISEHYFDPDFDEYYDKIEKEVEEFKQEVSKAKWEEVPDTPDFDEYLEKTEKEVKEAKK